jgi:ABC-2 type transport system permease protein
MTTLSSTVPTPHMPSPSPLPATGRDRAIPMERLIKVELRKAADTRAGRWLLGTIVGGVPLVMVGMVVVGLIQDRSFAVKDFVQFANFVPMGLLLPMLGLLSVTSEWSQRTNVVTFTLEPRRSRVVMAKLVNGVILSVLASTAAFLTGIAALGLFDLFGGVATWNLSVEMIGAFALLHLINVFIGFAFGMLILNTPAAIVAFFVWSFVLPTLFIGAVRLWGWAESIRPWIDFNYAQEPLGDGMLSGIDWTQFTATATVWFVIPVVLGVRRILRAEIK